MSKRSYSDIESGDSLRNFEKKQKPGSPRSRGSLRKAPGQALLELAENANELIDGLKSLKKWRKSLQDESQDDPDISKLQKEFEVLSRKLAPCLLALGSDTEAGASDKLQGVHDNLRGDSSPSCVPIPSSSVVPWRSSDIPDELPPLPKIKDPAMERQAFTHPGVSSRAHYERLEWLGDAYLEMIATAIIDRTFPNMPSGRCSQVREQLVRNVTLAGYFREYNMGSRARLPPELSGSAAQRSGRGRSADKDLIKTQGDMFEAYVAAVIVGDSANGLDECIKWLRAVWSRTIKDQIIKNERGAPVTIQNSPATEGKRTITPKDRLSQLIVVRGVELNYKDIPGRDKKDRNLGLPLFTVGVYLTGWGEDDKLLGWGTALGKKEAGQKAATRAMENKKMIKLYCQKKESAMEAMKAAQGLGEITKEP